MFLLNPSVFLGLGDEHCFPVLGWEKWSEYKADYMIDAYLC